MTTPVHYEADSKELDPHGGEGGLQVEKKERERVVEDTRKACWWRGGPQGREQREREGGGGHMEGLMVERGPLGREERERESGGGPMEGLMVERGATGREER